MSTSGRKTAFCLFALTCVAILLATSLVALAGTDNRSDTHATSNLSGERTYVDDDGCIVVACDGNDDGVGEMGRLGESTPSNDWIYVGKLKFELHSGNTLWVYGFEDGDYQDIVVPDKVEYNGAVWTVTKIDIGAFYRNNGERYFHCVSVGPSLEEIGSHAFENFKFMSWEIRQTIKSNLTTIGERAFANSNISGFHVPSGVTDIGKEAFSGCNTLTYVDVLAKSYTIGHRAFYGCENLSSINLENAYRISSEAFRACSALTDIDLSSAWDIRELAFEKCDLKHVTFASNITILEKDAFKGYCFSDYDNNILSHTPSGLAGKTFRKDIDNWYHQIAGPR